MSYLQVMLATDLLLHLDFLENAAVMEHKVYLQLSGPYGATCYCD